MFAPISNQPLCFLAKGDIPLGKKLWMLRSSGGGLPNCSHRRQSKLEQNSSKSRPSLDFLLDHCAERNLTFLWYIICLALLVCRELSASFFTNKLASIPFYQMAIPQPCGRVQVLRAFGFIPVCLCWQHQTPYYSAKLGECHIVGLDEGDQLNLKAVDQCSSTFSLRWRKLEINSNRKPVRKVILWPWLEMCIDMMGAGII